MAVPWFMMRRLCIALAAACLAAAAPAAESFPPSANYTAAFTPGNAIDVVVAAIREARTSIYVATYSFTSKAVALELQRAHRRHVQVFVVADAKDASEGYSAARFLANQGIPVRLNAQYAIQHNKFMVIDGETVQTGSLNYTAAAATRNAENVLVIRGAPQLARSYRAEWQRLWDGGTTLPPAY